MFLVTQKSRICVLLLLSFTPWIVSSLLISALPALPASLKPFLSSTVSTAPVANTSSGMTSTPTVNPMTLSKATLTTLHSPKSLTASAKTEIGKEVSSNYPILCRALSHISFPVIKQIFCNVSSLLPHLCQCLTLPLKALGPYLDKKLLRCHLSKLTSGKLLHLAKESPASNSTVLPKNTSQPQTTSQKLPPPVSTLSLPTAFFPLTSKTSLPPSGKTSPTFSPNISPSPPEASGQLHSTGPLFDHQPFIVSWNIPDLVCNRYNISLDTSAFKGVATPAKVPGQFLSLFYTDRLGLYPHVDLASGKQVNGGIPQRADLRASMNKARADINYFIPSETSRGLAVIDWEDWRPLWDRNWGAKRIYQTLSVAHEMRTNHSLTAQQASEKAKQQFQAAAKNVMAGILATGRAMRPNCLWGFYLFPNCYNYGWEKPEYTGRCSKEVKKQNDELFWLWESSTALYPSVYLQSSISDNPKAALMVRNRVQEALRVSALPRQDGAAPVFVYTRPVFVDQNRRFLSPADLVNTIGESAAVGASGSVLWGASADYDDQTSCEALSFYLSSTLNPYITNVTTAAQLCSNFLCRGNGRCVRKHYNSGHYLHLNPDNFKVVRVHNRYFVRGRPTFLDLVAFSRRFTCQCYKGLSCCPRTQRALAKTLMYSFKQRLYQKAHTLNKSTLDDMQQDNGTKDGVKKDFIG